MGDSIGLWHWLERHSSSNSTQYRSEVGLRHTRALGFGLRLKDVTAGHAQAGRTVLDLLLNIRLELRAIV